MKRLTEKEQEIFNDNVRLVTYYAKKIYDTLPSHIEYQDIAQYGYLGLIKAIKMYDKSYKTKFNTYAVIRIKGEILDGLRQMDNRPGKRQGGESVLHLCEDKECTLVDNEMQKWEDIVLIRRILLPFLARIPLRERAVLMYTYYWMLSQREIAAILGFAKGSISRIKVRGENILRRNLKLAGMKW